MMNVKEGGIHSAYIMSAALPLLQFIVIGNFPHFIIQALFQLVFITTILQDKMEEALIFMSPQEYMQALKGTILALLANTCIIIVPIQYVQSQAYRRILGDETKKQELEKQKIFLLSFSHELRNLINSLTGNIKIASLEKNLPKRIKELLLTSEVCGELLLHLVNNILDTGKVEINELEIDVKPTKIYDAFERAWGLCSELIQRKGLRGKMTIQNNIPKTLLIDHYRLTQIVLNLVGNALKFTEAGSINMTVEWRSDCQDVTEECFQPYPFNEDDDQDEGLFEKTRDFRVFENSSLVLDTNNRKINKDRIKPHRIASRGILKVIISDTGCGMSKEESAQLFQKFTQVTSDVSKKKLGTGLGLFISRQLCQKMNGIIRVFSTKDKGSCFIFNLPINPLPNTSEVCLSPDDFRSKVVAKQLKAMVVDDIPFNNLVLSNYFEKLGVEVIRVATTGVEAYEGYMEHTRLGNRPHIVAMDLDMPVMDGKQASRKIREFEAERGLSECFLMIVSGNCSQSEINECLDAERQIKANTFIKKPAQIEELMRIIEHRFLSD